MTLVNKKEKKIEDIKKEINDKGIKNIKIGLFDIDGIFRGKYISTKKFLSSLKSDLGFCNVIFGWDMQDQLYDNVLFSGWHNGYCDVPIRIIPNTHRVIPFEPETLLFLSELSGEEGKKICPRNIAQKLLTKLNDMGYRVLSGFEYEFFLFKETPESIRAKNYKDLTPLKPDFFGYSMIRNSVDSDIYTDILNLCEQMNLPLEGLHEETGPGVIEAALDASLGIESADRAALFKTYIKIFAQRKELLATFMAKWSKEYPGQSGHLHISLQDKNNSKNIFYDANRQHNMSQVMEHFIAGQQILMPEFLSLIASNINSYTRLIPGFWAPTTSSLGVDNRTCSLRIIKSEKSQRIEYRISSADSNPYLVFIAALCSGIWGIENKAKIVHMTEGNAYQKKFPLKLQHPKTLWEAAQRLKNSEVAVEYLGKEFVEHYVKTREWEEREFRKNITDWELKRYFEII